MIRTIYILNASTLSVIAVEHIADSVGRVYDASVMQERVSLALQTALDGSRGQYHADALLAQVLSRSTRNGAKWIGIVDVDLFVPVLTFVFGEAQFNGQAALVSTHRLANQFYGLPQDETLLAERLEKEIIHELGHTFGLYHCRQFECVMRSSTYVEEIDLKREVPCTSCKQFLRHGRQEAFHGH